MNQTKPLFDKVLVANRGEIALRIMRTLRKMGIRSVAVYSEADTNALHVQYADEAYYIGPSPATESYLQIPNIIAAIRKSGASAVHPGYGFLSENSHFAKALAREGTVLIGPSAKSIADMGDKISAKKLAEEAGVSTIPGFMGVIKNQEHAVEIAREIGFPIMVKAAAGGGGRGMRMVRNEEQVREAFQSASREARSSFSDARVFIEKFIETPRHIEVQVLADQHGNVVCAGERECSIQRHHQKVIEEAPSPFIDEATRQAMYAQVVSLATKTGYYSAGTVEFIVDKEKNFYFLEMNTRLQVEHCVTELVTGLDIVEIMVRIAAGEPLPITQKDIVLNGWAIESRICAEDPKRGFLPSIGRITEYEPPTPGTNIRIDSGVYAGGEVSMFYDSMIAKLNSYAPTRTEAIEHMRRALGEFIIRGISHNISFLEAIMAHPRFEAGDINTHFIDDEYPEGFLGADLTSEITRHFLAVAMHMFMMETYRSATISGQTPGRKPYVTTRWVVTIGRQFFPVIIRKIEDGFVIRLDRERISVQSTWTIGTRLFRGMVNGKPVSIKVEEVLPGGGYMLSHAGTTIDISIRSPRIAELEGYMPIVERKGQSKLVEAPLSGKIIAIKVAVGAEVKPGDDLMVIEAMKMENVICAERAGTIKTITITEGSNVSAGELLIELA